MIYGERVRQARELRGLTQTALATKVGVGQSAIAQIEAGLWQPLDPVVEAIALKLNFPPAFFRNGTPRAFPLGSLLYRAHAATTTRERSRAHRYAQVVYELAECLATQVQSLPVHISRLDEDPLTAARVTRDRLGLSPDTPIPHVIRAVERTGAFVLALPLGAEEMDSFSLWAGFRTPRPVIAYLAGRSGDRQRLNIAHELGHLVLHGSAQPRLKKAEDEAYTFAAEFLLPEQAMRQEIVPPVTLAGLAELKPRWGVSVQALVKRARTVDLITERQYRYFFEQLSAKGWRTREPANLDVPVEQPRALRKMAELLYGDPVDVQRLASDLHLSVAFIREVLAAGDAVAPASGAGRFQGVVSLETRSAKPPTHNGIP